DLLAAIMDNSSRGRPDSLDNLSGADGYFKGRKMHKPSVLSKENVAGVSKQLLHQSWSQDVHKAELEIKNFRLGQCTWIVCGWQILLLFLFSFMFIHVDKQNPANLFSMISHGVLSLAENCFCSVTSAHGIMLLMLAVFKMFMVSTCLTPSGERYAESRKEQIVRYATLRSLLKPFLFGATTWFQCLIFLHLFDNDYDNLFVIKETSDGLTNIYVLENPLLIRIAAFVAGLEFFVTTFVSRGFQLQFPSSRVSKCIWSCVIEFVQPLQNVRESVYVASLIWLTCLLIGPTLYSPFISAMGMRMTDLPNLERVFMFLDIRFIYRLFLWTALPRVTLQFYVNVLGAYFTKIANFPIGRPSTTANCLTLCDGMKGNNLFVKYISFYELNLKAQLVNRDVTVFFKLSHPGNHPVNWNGVFAASCEVLTEINADVASFLMSVELSPNVRQCEEFQTKILRKLRRRSPSPQIMTQTHDADIADTNIRQATMKDLTSNTFIPLNVEGLMNKTMSPNSQRGFQNHNPTVYDLVKQIPATLWNELKVVCREMIVSVYNDISSLLLVETLDKKIPEKQIANCLQNAALSLWAMKGTLELMCISVKVDPLGIVHKDLQCFIEKVVETYDVMTVLDYYVVNTFQQVDNVDEQILEKNTATIRKLISASVFVLGKLHCTFSHCNKLLSIENRLQSRIEDIISYN
ncbi:Nucleoporin NDC1, partial [Orchesella cincta]